MAWIYFVVLAPPAAGEGKPAAGPFTAYLVSKFIQFGFPLVWVAALERHRLRLSIPSFKGLAFGVGFGLLVGALLFLAYYGILAGNPMLSDTAARVRDKLILFRADTPTRYLCLGLFIAGLHPLLEEYYWRWFVFGELRRRVAVGVAIVLSSLAFMAHHVIVLGVYFPQHFVTAVMPFSLCVAVGGAVWAWLYQRTGTIYSAWISHLLIDAAILAVGYDLVFGR
jgi:membrane protease YdiL (CAAX protease family)